MTKTYFATNAEAIFRLFSGRKYHIMLIMLKCQLCLIWRQVGRPSRAPAPHKVGRNCELSLRQWNHGNTKSLAFGVPMVCREPNGPSKECHFRSCVVAGSNVESKHKIQYPNLLCAIRPIPHEPDAPIPFLPRVLEKAEASVSEEFLSDSQLIKRSECE